MIEHSAQDVSLELATRSHYGTSHSPEKRGRYAVRCYVEQIEAVIAEFENFVTDDNRDAIVQDLEYYRTSYIQKLQAYWHAHSRVISPLVTGPAKFPVRSNNKRCDTADRRRNELLEWSNKMLETFRKRYDPRRIARQPIRMGDDDATLRLREKLAKAEERREKMKAANKIARKKGMSVPDRVQAVMMLFPGISEVTAVGILEPDQFTGKPGFPTYELTNLGANIRRMKQRLVAIEAEEALRAEGIEDYETDCGDDGIVTVSENVDENRLQIFFEGKPSEAMRSRLKSRAFRWAPSQGAWQRQLTPNARIAIREILSNRREQ